MLMKVVLSSSMQAARSGLTRTMHSFVHMEVACLRAALSFCQQIMV